MSKVTSRKQEGKIKIEFILIYYYVVNIFLNIFKIFNPQVKSSRTINQTSPQYRWQRCTRLGTNYFLRNRHVENVDIFVSQATHQISCNIVASH